MKECAEDAFEESRNKSGAFCLLRISILIETFSGYCTKERMKRYKAVRTGYEVSTISISSNQRLRVSTQGFT